MSLQPFGGFLGVIGHGRRRRVLHVCEDGVKHRAGTRDELVNVFVDLAVNVGKEEQFFVSLDHEAGKMHGAEIVLRRREHSYAETRPPEHAKENAMSQSHLVVDLPITGPANAKALPNDLPR